MAQNDSKDVGNERCPACLRDLDETSGDPVPAYGKTYCRSCGSSLFDSVSDRSLHTDTE